MEGSNKFEGAESIEDKGEPAGEVEHKEEDKGDKEDKKDEKEEYKWWAIHVQSGYEDYVINTIRERAREKGISDLIGDIFVPKEDIFFRKKDGTEGKREKRFFPGYMLIKMVMNEKTWFLIRGTPHVTGFVGSRTNPRPVSEAEVNELKKKIDTGEIVKAFEISRGDRVRITDGPFKNFTGIIEDIARDRSRVRILVSVFGRQTPIDIDSGQVEKIS